MQEPLIFLDKLQIWDCGKACELKRDKPVFKLAWYFTAVTALPFEFFTSKKEKYDLFFS